MKKQGIQRFLRVLLILLMAVSALGVTTSAEEAEAEPQAATRPGVSKIPSLVEQRIARIKKELQLRPRLSPDLMKTLDSTDNGELQLEFHAAGIIGEAEAAALEKLGATVLLKSSDISWPGNAPPQFGLIVARLPYDKVEQAAALPWVVAVRPVEHNPPDTGTFESEGVELHRADAAQAAGVTGEGVTVGVISDGVTSLGAAQALGDLPATVTIPPGCVVGTGDEGTAMLEIVHDMAPGADLMFCATGNGVLQHVAAQNNLAMAGVNVISEDIAFDAEPAFQKGIAAVNGDSLATSGISVHSSAGNLGDQHAARVAAVGTGTGPDGMMDPCGMATNTVAIAPGGDTTFDITVNPGADGTTLTVTLQWSEPRAIFPTAGAGGFTNLNLFVADQTLANCLGTSVAMQGPAGAGDTIEQVTLNFPANAPAAPLKLYVDVAGTGEAVQAPILDLRWRGAVTSNDAPTRAGSINPDSNYTGPATSAAAANAGPSGGSTDPAVAPLEPFSAGGPISLMLTTLCPGGTYPCPGDAVAGAAGTTRSAPDWTAADGVSVSGVGGFGSGTCPAGSQGDCLFFGTSAATPHAASCDALVRDATSITAVSEINARLAAAAIDRGSANDWGAGVLDCLGASNLLGSADLEITKLCKPDATLPAGDQYRCTLIVENLGPAAAERVALRDEIRSNENFTVTSITTDPSRSDNCLPTAPIGPGRSATVECQLTDPLEAKDIGGGGRWVIEYTIVADEPQSINNCAQVFTRPGGTADFNPANNQSCVGVGVTGLSDLALVKSDAPDPVTAGTNLTYSIMVTNNGPSTAQNVVIEDVLPPQVTAVSVTSPDGDCAAGTPGDPAHPTRCNVDSLAPSDVAAMTIVVQVSPNVPAGTLLHNTATTRSDNPDPNTADNVASTTTLVTASADLSVTKSDFPDPVVAGTTLKYEVTVTNNGPSTATGVTITDTLPTQVAFVGTTISNGGTCVLLNLPPNTLSCDLNDLNPGESVTVVIEVVVAASVPNGTIITNTVTVSAATPDPNAGNNSASTNTTVNAQADLAITKTSDGDTFNPSEMIVYTLTVVNEGPSDAQNVIVVDSLPSVIQGNSQKVNYVFDTCDGPPDPNYLPATHMVACSMGTLPPGGTRSFKIYVRVQGAVGVITNSASVASSTTDPNPANNTAVKSVLVGGGL